jgi:hypothetical protein
MSGGKAFNNFAAAVCLNFRIEINSQNKILLVKGDN